MSPKYHIDGMQDLCVSLVLLGHCCQHFFRLAFLSIAFLGLALGLALDIALGSIPNSFLFWAHRELRIKGPLLLPHHPHRICPPCPRPRQPPLLLAQPLAHSALQAKHRARVQKLEAQIQDLEARLLKKRKRIERITHYVQPYDDDGKVPCTLVGVRSDRYEALLQLPC